MGLERGSGGAPLPYSWNWVVKDWGCRLQRRKGDAGRKENYTGRKENIKRKEHWEGGREERNKSMGTDL